MTELPFSEEAINEAAAFSLSDELLEDRKPVQGITIDGPTSRDLDDAIHLETSGERVTIHISIADVATCVHPNSALFREARQKVATQYRRSTSIPMLPHRLSEDKLSLVEGHRRPALTFTIALSPDLEIENLQVQLTMLTNRRRYDYESVDRILDAMPGDPDFRFLSQAYALAQALMDRRRQRGALVIYDLVHRLHTNEEGALLPLGAEQAHKANIIVQEFMILTNAALAQYAALKEIPLLFRNHTVKRSTPERSEIIQQYNDAILNPKLIEALRLRAELWFNKATYDAILKGHYGLNLPAYTHLTSPLRRFPDLVNHVMLKAAIQGEPFPFTHDELFTMSKGVNDALENVEKERRGYYKTKSIRQTQAAVRATELARLTTMESTKFKRYLKRVCKDNMLTDGFEQALKARLEDGKLDVEEVYFILAETPEQDQRWDALKDAALQLVLRSTGWNEQLLHRMKQGGGLNGLREDVQPCEDGFVARYLLTVDGKEVSSPVIDVARKKKDALRAAAGRFLTSYFGRQLIQAENAIIEQATPHSAKVEEVHTESVAEADNFVGLLLELIAQHKNLSVPGFAFEQSGPSHAPIIRCTCTMGTQDGELVAVATARNKKEAKQLAAGEMLTIVRPLAATIGETRQPQEIEIIREEIATENHVGALAEWCRSYGVTSPPAYTFKRSGPSHVPAFTCTCSLHLHDETVAVAATSSSKSRAKQYAAKEMLSLLFKYSLQQLKERGIGGNVEARAGSQENYFGNLLDALSRASLPPPEIVYRKEGPPHCPQFTCTLAIAYPDTSARLKAHSVSNAKNTAKQLASRELLRMMDEIKRGQIFTGEEK